MDLLLGRFHRLALSLLLCVLAGTAALADEAMCPSFLKQATRLVVVTTDRMTSIRARLTLFERGSIDDPWRLVGTPEAAVIGKNGLAWSFDQVPPADRNGFAKREGDKRTPAGIFRAGPAFGTDAREVSGYVVLQPDTICVDDAASPLYNTITTRGRITKSTSHERMSEIPLYRQGVVIKNETSRRTRSGSCIFLHVWRGPSSPTVGCIAAEQRVVMKVQSFLDGEAGAFAILPKQAGERFQACLPMDASNSSPSPSSAPGTVGPPRRRSAVSSDGFGP